MSKNYKELVKSALSGDESAFEELYTMTKDSAYFIALSMTHNEEDAMDILQESYIKAFTRLNTLDKPESFESWLKRIVVNCCNDFLKRKKILLFSEVADEIEINKLDEETDTEVIPHESIDKKEASRLIMEIINGLDENKRLVIIMYYYNGMSTREIAEALDLSVSTTKYYLSAARKEIRTGLEKLDKEGTRLYAVIPFTIFPSLIGQAAGNTNAPVFSVISKKVMAGVNAGGGISSAASSTAAKAGKGVFLKTTASRIAAGAAAVVIVGGGITAAVVIRNNNNSVPVENSVVSQVAQNNNSSNDESIRSDNDDSSTDMSGSAESSTESENSYDPSEDFEYEIGREGVKITKCISMDNEIVIPDNIEGKPVVEIGVNGDIYGYDLNTVFENNDFLTTITIPDSVKIIGANAFSYCTALERVTIPNSVEIIDDYAFNNCTALTSIDLSSGVSEIGYNAFQGCVGLKSIDIPDSVVSIEDYAFADCTALSGISIADSVVNVGYGAFSDTAWFNYQPDGLVYVGKVAYEYKGKGEMPVNTSIELNADTKAITDNAFRNSDNLISINIPDGVTNIGSQAFRDCSNLTSIDIPDSITHVGTQAFTGTAWYDSQPDGLVYVGKVAYEYKGEMPENTTITIMKGTIGIGNNVFGANTLCEALIDIDIPDGVTIIDDYAFRNCSSLKSLTIPKSVNEIGEAPFDFCSSLTDINVDENNMIYSSENGVLFNKDKSVLIAFPEGKTGTYIIPDGVTAISEFAFPIYNLTSITIPDSVTKIYDNSLYSLNAFENFTIHGKSGSAAEKYAKEKNIKFIAE